MRNTLYENVQFHLPEESQYLRIQTVGRKTGKQHQVLVRFITIGSGRIIAFPLNTGKQDWVRNIRRNPDVTVFSPSGGTFRGIASTKEISDLKDPILSIFTRKYGSETVKRWYFGQRIYVRLEVVKIGSLDTDQIVYDDLETAFDGVAETYDFHIFHNPINTWLRDVSINVMYKVFKPGSTVLEIGCGTGTETLALAKRGINVIATDISGKMLEVLKRKATRLGLDHKINPIHCRPPDLLEEITSLGYTKIDGAYSTYGAINTEPQLTKLVVTLRSLLRNDSPLVLGVWNKYCVYEILGYLVKGRPDMAFARLRNPVPIGKSRFCVSTNAFSAKSMDTLLRPYFIRRSLHGVVISLPPSNLTRYLPRGSMFQHAKRFDYNLGSIFPFNQLGDHFLGVYTLEEGL